MAFLVLENEKTLAEVVSRAYGDLRAADAKRVAEALLRANPQLKNVRDAGRGTLVVVPSVPGLRAPAARREEQTPAGESVLEVRDSLEAYRKQLGENVDAERAAVTRLRALLKSKEMKAIVRALPEAGDYLERVTATTHRRGEEHDDRIAFLKMLTKAEADVDALAKKLR